MLEAIDPLLADVTAAQDGSREALERVVRSIAPAIRRLALRFFGCPDHAEDAAQEALVRVVTRLETFEGGSAFTTWAYRVAVHRFLSLKRSPLEREARSFEEFEDDLAADTGPLPRTPPSPEHELVLAEIRVGCTLAMLTCLEREARMAYILGEIMELEQDDACHILACSASAYRKRLERARARVTGLMKRRCGVFDAANHCQCEARIPIATARGYLNPKSLVYAPTLDGAHGTQGFREVVGHIRRLEEAQRAAALYQSHPEPRPRADFAAELRALLSPFSSSGAAEAQG